MSFIRITSKQDQACSRVISHGQLLVSVTQFTRHRVLTCEPKQLLLETAWKSNVGESHRVVSVTGSQMVKEKQLEIHRA